MNNIKRLFDFPYYQLENYNLEKSLVSKKEGKWIATSTQEYIDKANAISRGLIQLGIQPNDKVAIISMTNRTEWNICDIGILQTGAQDVPIYPTISQEDYAYILNHSQSVYCFVSCEFVLEKINNIKDQVPSLKGVYSFDTIAGCNHWEKLLALGKDKSYQEEVEKRKNNIKELDTKISNLTKNNNTLKTYPNPSSDKLLVQQENLKVLCYHIKILLAMLSIVP